MILNKIVEACIGVNLDESHYRQTKLYTALINLKKSLGMGGLTLDS